MGRWVVCLRDSRQVIASDFFVNSDSQLLAFLVAMVLGSLWGYLLFGGRR